MQLLSIVLQGIYHASGTAKIGAGSNDTCYNFLVGISIQNDSKFNHRCKTKVKIIEFEEGSFKLSSNFLMVQIAR